MKSARVALLNGFFLGLKYVLPEHPGTHLRFRLFVRLPVCVCLSVWFCKLGEV